MILLGGWGRSSQPNSVRPVRPPMNTPIQLKGSDTWDTEKSEQRPCSPAPMSLLGSKRITTRQQGLRVSLGRKGKTSAGRDWQPCATGKPWIDWSPVPHPCARVIEISSRRRRARWVRSRPARLLPATAVAGRSGPAGWIAATEAACSGCLVQPRHSVTAVRHVAAAGFLSRDACGVFLQAHTLWLSTSSRAVLARPFKQPKLVALYY